MSVMTWRRGGRCSFGYLEVVSGIGILIAGNDLRGHPVRRSNEGVSPAHRSVQLSTDTKVHCGSERQEGMVRSEINLSNALLLNVKHWVHSAWILCGVRKERCGQRHSCLISAGINRGQSRTNLIIWCAFSSLPGGNEKKSQLLILMSCWVSNVNKEQPLFYAFSFELKPCQILVDASFFYLNS